MSSVDSYNRAGGWKYKAMAAIFFFYGTFLYNASMGFWGAIIAVFFIK